MARLSWCPLVLSPLTRRRAEARNSRLQRPLMEYLVALVKHHKGEVAAALGTDPTLQVRMLP